MWPLTLTIGEGAPRAPAITFDAVYRAHGAMVWRSMRALGVRDADLEDACQEVFVVVHRKLDTFEGKHPITTWLYGICLRVASAWRRRAHRRYEVVTDAPPEGAPVAGPDVTFERHRASQALQRILDTLDDEKRAVFVLFELAELPMAEVAATVEVPLKTAYSRLYAARAHVEAALASLAAVRP